MKNVFKVNYLNIFLKYSIIDLVGLPGFNR